MFSRSVNVWFVCKTCRESFQKLENFLEHKKQNHLEEFQETECIVFEESSISIQNNDEYRNFTSAKDSTTAHAQMLSHSTNASRGSRNFDEFPPVIVKIETLFEPNNDDVPSPSVEYPYDSAHQDFPQSQDPTNYQNQIYSHPSFTTNGPNFDLTTAAVEAKAKSSTKTKKSIIVTHTDQEGKVPFGKSVEQQQQKQHPPLNAFVLAKKLTVNEIQSVETVKNDSNSFNNARAEHSAKSTNSPGHQKFMDRSVQKRMGFPIPAPAPAPAPVPANTKNKIVQLQCKLCSKKYNTLAELHSHQASCILTSRFQERFCVLCNRVFCNSIYLKSHILRIHPTEEERARRLKLISELSPNAVVLRNSPQKKRPLEPEPESSRKQSKPLKCSMCDMSFYCNSLLTIHLKTHYREERAFKCSQPNCGKSYNLKKHLKQHLSTHFDAQLLSKFSKIKSFGKVSNTHRIQTATATTYATSSDASIVNLSDDPFSGQKTAQGQQPAQIFTDTTHLASEPQPAPQFELEFDLDGDYKCRLCLHKCDTAQDLRTHVATCALNHESRHCYCVTCNKKFPNSKILRVHTFRFHGYGHGLNAAAPPGEKKSRPPKQPLPPRSYKCQICSKKYMYKLPFQSHMKSHYASKTDDRKTYKCHFCPKCFNYPSLLKYHLRTHPESEVNVASFAAVVENLMIQKKTATKNIEKEPRSSESRVPVPPQHAVVVRPKIKNNTNKTNCGNFCCTYMDCDQTFKYRKPFRKHLLSHTGRMGTETISEPGPGVRTSPGTGTGFRTSHGIGIGEGSYQSSTNSGSVSDHLYSGKAFQRNLRFTNHLKTHAEDARRYRCPLPKCDKGFKFKTGIKRHLLFHADLRSFKCPHLNCEQTFEL